MSCGCLPEWDSRSRSRAMATFRIQKNSENPYVMLDKFSVNDAN